MWIYHLASAHNSGSGGMIFLFEFMGGLSPEKLFSDLFSCCRYKLVICLCPLILFSSSHKSR